MLPYVAVAVTPLVLFVAGFVAVVTQSFLLDTRPLSVAVAISLIPSVLAVSFAVWRHSLAYAVVAAMLTAIVVISPIYSRHVLKFHADEIALLMSFIPAPLLWPFNPGIVQFVNLSGLYSDTLLSALTLIGLIFTVSIFFLQTQTVAERGLIQAMLKAFLSLFIVLAFWAAFALVNTHSDLHVSIQMLRSRSDLTSPNSLSAYIFFTMLCLLISCVVYLLNVFSVLLNPERRETP